MEMISLRIEGEFLRDLERAMKRYRYSTKTEFVRAAIRDKISDLDKEYALRAVEKLAGSSKRKTSGKDLHKARKKIERIYKRRFI